MSTTTDTAAAPLTPREAEFVSLLAQVKPADMLDVLRELCAVALSVGAVKH